MQAEAVDVSVSDRHADRPAAISTRGRQDHAIAYFDADGAPVLATDVDGLLLTQIEQLTRIDSVARASAR
jgi:hypothetical protein